MAEVIRLNQADEVSPHSIEGEQQVLGAILLDQSRVPIVAQVGGPDLFFDPVHADIYRYIARCERDGVHSSVVTMRAWADEHEGIRELGGSSYLVRLAGYCCAESQLGSMVDFLAETRAKRGLYEAISEARRALSQGEASAAQIAGQLEASVVTLEGGTGPRPISMMSATTTAGQQIMAAHEGRDGDFVPTGIHAVDRLLNGLYPGELILLGGRPSMGKAQPLGSGILMSDGTWCQMGNIRVGDRVASPDGRPSRVSGVFPQGERQVYRVTFQDGRSVRCCGEHLWTIRSSRFDGDRVVSTDKMRSMLQKKRYHGRISVPLVSGNFGDSKDLPVDPWLLGVIIGNGSLTSGHCSISTADAQTLWAAQEVLTPAHQLVASGSYDYRIRRADGFPENEILGALRSLGLYDCLSVAKFIPEIYKTAPRGDRVQLLRGLLDTDGWVEKFGAIRYSTSSFQLAEDVAGLVRSLGGVCSISEKTPKYTHNGERRVGQPHFVCNIRHEDGADLFNLERKRRRCNRTKPVRLTIISIEPDGFEPVQCISVTHPTSLYVTDGYTLTHNTATAINMAANAARAGRKVVFCSLEMNPEAIALRLLSERMAATGNAVAYRDLRGGKFNERAREDLGSALEEVAQLPIEFLPRQYQDVGALLAGAKRTKAKMGGLDLLVVDYVQLMRSAQAKNRYETITEVSRALKNLAGMLNVPVLALSQLSRAVEQRDDKRPRMDDLRESGQLEQDADAVLFCYRDEYYLERERPETGTDEQLEKWEDRMRRARNRLEIIVAKQRQGPVGTANVFCNVAFNRIWEPEQ